MSPTWSRLQKRASGIGYELAPFGHLTVPWMVLQGDADRVCDPAATRSFVTATGAARLFPLPKVGHGFAVTGRWEPQFVESFRSLASRNMGARVAPPDAAPGVEDLGLVEVPAIHPAAGDTMAVIVTGDGGWADIDKGIATKLVEAGVPVVGWSSLRYYWSPRTPESAAADLARIVSYYSARWNRARCLIVGYSFGADVVPFLVNRLPAALGARIRSVSLLGPSNAAAFEFHVSGWLGGEGGGSYPTVPEMGRLTMPVTCVHGSDETDSACLAVRSPRVHVVRLGQGHHFSGDYARLAELILTSASSD